MSTGAITEESYICICCPLGCLITATLQDEKQGRQVVEVQGNTCNRGKEYVMQEAVNPVRMVTATVTVQGRLMPVSVKSSEPVPKSCIQDILAQLRTCTVQPPVYKGDIIIKNVSKTNIDIVATKNVE